MIHPHENRGALQLLFYNVFTKSNGWGCRCPPDPVYCPPPWPRGSRYAVETHLRTFPPLRSIPVPYFTKICPVVWISIADIFTHTLTFIYYMIWFLGFFAFIRDQWQKVYKCPSFFDIGRFDEIIVWGYDLMTCLKLFPAINAIKTGATTFRRTTLCRATLTLMWRRDCLTPLLICCSLPCAVLPNVVALWKFVTNTPLY